jgi:hypothetical protein
MQRATSPSTHPLSLRQQSIRNRSRFSIISRNTLETIVIILIILWLLGWLAFPIGGSLIHLLLVVILVIVVIRLLQGRSAL